MYFKCLGYDHGRYFYLVLATGQIKSLTASQHRKAHLMVLAPLDYWMVRYPSSRGINWDTAVNALIRDQELSGVYDLRGVTP